MVEIFRCIFLGNLNYGWRRIYYYVCIYFCFGDMRRGLFSARGRACYICIYYEYVV